MLGATDDGGIVGSSSDKKEVICFDEGYVAAIQLLGHVDSGQL